MNYQTGMVVTAHQGPQAGLTGTIVKIFKHSAVCKIQCSSNGDVVGVKFEHLKKPSEDTIQLRTIRAGKFAGHKCIVVEAPPTDTTRRHVYIPDLGLRWIKETDLRKSKDKIVIRKVLPTDDATPEFFCRFRAIIEYHDEKGVAYADTLKTLDDLWGIIGETEFEINGS